MKRVFKSDAEIDLNRCANALEKCANSLDKIEQMFTVLLISKEKRGQARNNDSPSSKKSSKSRTKESNEVNK